MTAVKVAILGFGTVGEGIFNILKEKRKQLKETLGVDIEVAKILVHNVSKEREGVDASLLTNRFEDILALPQLDVVFEAIV